MFRFTFNAINYIEEYRNIGMTIFFFLFWKNCINVQYNIL